MKLFLKRIPRYTESWKLIDVLVKLMVEKGVLTEQEIYDEAEKRGYQLEATEEVAGSDLSSPGRSESE
jgi:hypothetical protein